MNEILEKIDEMILNIEKCIANTQKQCKSINMKCNVSHQMATRRTLGWVKEIIQAEQKEPCEWCSQWRLEFNAIDEDGNMITTEDHEVIGGLADYCPVCGRMLNQPSESEE